MNPKKQTISFVAIAFFLSLFGTHLIAQSKVRIVKKGDRFELQCDGKPFQIKGVGADGYLKELSSAGGNVVRTWASDKLGPILDEAQKHGLKVCAGLWMGHQRHGFNYQNMDSVLQQYNEKIAFVKKHKDHPALLMWAVGNEAEGEGKDPSVWYAINHLAREIKNLDPHHPTMTVIAELGPNENKVKAIEQFCPDIDVVGINSYGGIESVGERYLSAKPSKPYVITEHGTLGPWEVGKTSWGSPIEWTSTEKAAFYKKGYQANAVNQSGQCLGTFAFIWGHKQETSATWFGMLLPDGTRVEAADVMTELWTGKPPANRCPQITSLKSDQSGVIKPGSKFEALIKATDAENDKLTYKWVLLSDSSTIGEGGDPQESESAIKDALKADGPKVTVTMPKGGGGYRLFAYVFDGQGGAAVGNIPLLVAAPIKIKKAMTQSKLPYVVYGDESRDSVYIPSGYMGNAVDIAMDEKCKDDPFKGATCIKAQYKSSSAWGGVLWQSPAEDWDGTKPGGANLTGATHLEFYVRGSEGGEVVNFVFGVLDGNQPYRDTAKGELKDIKLTKEWTKMSFPLEGLDLRQIKTGFGWSLAGQEKPVTFYLDEIRFVKK